MGYGLMSPSIESTSIERENSEGPVGVTVPLEWELEQHFATQESKTSSYSTAQQSAHPLDRGRERRVL